MGRENTQTPIEPLPMAAASCSLDQRGLSRQLERYRIVGAGAELIERSARRITIRVGEHAAREGTVQELVAIERSCCPFFELDWRRSERQLTVAVADAEHEPALDALAHALDCAI